MRRIVATWGWVTVSIVVGAVLVTQLRAAPPAGPIRTVSSNPIPTTVTWQPDLKSARREAIATDKPIVIVFGASWCGYCKKLERETLGDPRMAQYINKQFVAVHLDFDKDRKAAEILEVKSLPATVVVNHNADLLGRIVGYVDSTDYRKALDAALEYERELQASTEPGK